MILILIHMILGGVRWQTPPKKKTIFDHVDQTSAQHHHVNSGSKNLRAAGAATLAL